MHQPGRGKLPDYTTATLALAFVNLIWSLLLVWAWSGLPAVMVTAVFADYLITRLDHHLHRRR